ncbi:NACHT domain-containing protein [Streptomyces sp. NPDC050619]|uniref:NACHT domain-containing protein n=1 Tax=Streptomyces sp. NPDC050619 TaxID=3157214 RepID=UPI00342FC472
MVGLRTRRTDVALLAILALSLAVALWLSRRFHVASLAATLVSVLLGAPGLVLAWLAYRGDRTEAAADLDAKARTLAAVVLAAETGQVKQLLGPGGHRINLTFRHFPEPGNNAVGAEPRGSLGAVVRYYRRLEPTRLVITGGPGAGKTVLALHFLLAVLTDPDRTDADPVPVRLSLSAWNTVRPLHEWIAEQIGERFRDRGITAADARALVDRQRILPVLDGLDEMDLDSVPVARRRATRALDQLNAYQDAMRSAPVVLTCRTAQYAKLAEVDVRMREAARIRIDPLEHGQIDEYFTARVTDPGRWEPVRAALAAAPDCALARALDTPWRLNLAVTVHEQRHPDTLAHLYDPAELCVLPDPGAVRDHLLVRYLPAAVSQHPHHAERYTAEQTHRWLAALAVHLESAPPTAAAAGTATAGVGTDLILHRLWPMAGTGRVRVVDTLSSTLISVVFATVLVIQAAGLPTRQLMAGVVPALAGILAIWRSSRASVPAPRTVRLWRSRGPARRHRRARALTGALTGALALGLSGGLGAALSLGPVGALVAVPAGAFVGALAGALAFALLGSATTDPAPAGARDLVQPTDPRHLVRDDLLFGALLALTCALIVALNGGLTGGRAFGLTAGTTTALWIGVTSGLAIGASTGLCILAGAGRRYLVFLVCSRGRLPLRLGGFLNWAYEAGLLRISGVAYQFRHREFQDWLARHPGP